MLLDLTRRRALQLLGAVHALGFGSLTSSLGAAASSASGWTQVAKLIAEDGGTENAFGQSVALDGHTALIGANGQTYVFAGSAGDWSRRATLTPPPDDDSSSFGESVAFDGTTAVVGAPSDGEGDDQTEQQRLANLGYTGVAVGSAYAFTRSDGSWTRQAQFVPPEGERERGTQFGSSVAVDGETFLVGATDGRSEESGVVYVFARSEGGWTLTTRLTPDDANAEYFGWSVALDDDTAIVGAKWTGPATGAAYAFTRSDGDWTREAKLVADDGDEEDTFGSSVALDGDTAVVAAERDEDPHGKASGSAYVFARSDGDWTQEMKLTAADGDETDFFGSSVAIDGDTIFVGAALDEDPNGKHAGATYVFTSTGGEWTQRTKLAASDGDCLDSFGESIALENGTAFIGAAGEEDPLGYGAGATYVYWKEQREVTMAVKPGSESGPINPDANGVVPVTVLHTDDFDPAARIDVGSLRFGAPDVVDGGGGAAPAHGGHVEDVTGDGADDLVVHFPTRETGFGDGDTIGKLIGETTDGVAVFGTDTVRIVGGRRRERGNSP